VDINALYADDWTFKRDTSLDKTWQADPDTDEVYARMTLQPVSNVSYTSWSSVRSFDYVVYQYCHDFRILCLKMILEFELLGDTVRQGDIAGIRTCAETKQATDRILLQNIDRKWY
jgi:hypothetical protein